MRFSIFVRAKNEIFRVKMRFSIFGVKNEVSVAKIESIILSTFRVKTIDYRLRLLE